MRQDAEVTRTRLVRAAESLFAARGLDGVSMNEVQRAAGQKNKSALQYHFGTKESLVQAILDKHVPRVELRRHAMLDALETREDYGVRDLMRALVVPVFERLDDPDGGAAYVSLLAQIIGTPSQSGFWVTAMRTNRGADRLMRLLERLVPELPSALRMPRYLLVTQLLFHGAADFGRHSTSDPPLFSPDARGLFVENLVDVLTAIATAPVSPTTAELLPAARKAKP